MTVRYDGVLLGVYFSFNCNLGSTNIHFFRTCVGNTYLILPNLDYDCDIVAANYDSGVFEACDGDDE